MQIGYSKETNIALNNPNDLTVEELIGIVTKDGKAIPTLVDDKSNVRDFLREFEVMDGSTPIPNYLLYYCYRKKWNPHGIKISKIGFLRKCSVIFTSKRTGKIRYYLLNKESFDLSEESLNDAKEFDKRYRNKISKKREPKIKGKVPSIATEI